MSQITRIYHSKLFIVELAVNTQYAQLRLDQFLKIYYPSLSRNFIQRKINKKDIFIKNRNTLFKTKPNTKVQFQDLVCMHVDKGHLEEGEIFGDQYIPWDFELPIIYENKDFLVVNKPPFMLTHPTGRQLFHTASNYLQEKLQQNVHSVHRLDKETSGLLIFVKKPEISEIFTDYFATQKIQKCYFLISKKNKTTFKNTLWPLIAKEPLTLAMATSTEKGFIPLGIAEKVNIDLPLEEKTQNALTHFYLLEENEEYLVCLAFPKTGRQHQIRLHAAYHGFPILGDKLYLEDPSYFYRYKEKELTTEDVHKLHHFRQALHAISLKIPNVTEKIYAPISLDLQELITKIFPHLNLNVLRSKIVSILEKNF